jgi:hypothetical protein
MTKTAATRRSFIALAGAALSAPVAAAAATLPHRVAEDPLQARLAHLEDLNEIRALNQALFSDPSSAQLEPDIRAISPVDFGQHDVIEVAVDRQTATARLSVTVHTETAIGPECTLVEMARLQGGGMIARAEPAVLENAYVRTDGVWKILRSTHRPA